MHPLALPCLAMSAINAYLGIYHLILALRRPKAREHLPFALLCLVVAAYDLFCLGLYDAASLAEGVFWQRLQFLSVPLISFATVWFIARFTGTERARGTRLFLAWSLALVPLALAAALAGIQTVSEATPALKHVTWAGRPLITYYESDIGAVFVLVMISGLVTYTYLVYLLLRHYRHKPSATILAVLIGNLAYFAGVTNDSLVSARVYSFVYVSEYAFFVLILSMGYVLLTRFVDLQSYVEAHNVNLERAVAERTAALQRSLEHQSAMHTQLVAASRRSGMADVATNVLHNIGNALNSVNVSVDLLEEAVRHSRLPGLSRVIQRICNPDDDLAGFLTGSAQHKQLPQYLAAATARLEDEHATLASELASLRHHVEHIKLAVDTQQTHARAPAVTERTSLAAVLDEAVDASLQRHDDRGVALDRSYAPLPEIDIDRHKLLLVVSTLVDNAWRAIADIAGSDKRIHVRLRTVADDRVAIEIEDNGRGIPPEDLTRIFHHDFATRDEYRGLGLHESACAAAELRGSLRATSDGPGRGACFTLVLPARPPPPPV